MKTRRQFLSRTAAAVAGTALIPPVLANRHAVDLGSELTYATFAQLLDTIFEIRNVPEGRVRLRLVDAQLHSSDGGECFTLTLRGPAGSALEQATYQFRNQRLGTFDMFIVPGVADAAAPDYFATFNRCA